jgi:hypothetical protein
MQSGKQQGFLGAGILFSDIEGKWKENLNKVIHNTISRYKANNALDHDFDFMVTSKSFLSIIA